MGNADSSGESSDHLLERLALIRQDPQIRAYARRRAYGDADRAEDGLQAAFVNVATVKHPERIRDLRAYFLRALRNEILGQCALPRPVQPEDLEDVMDRGAAVCGPVPPWPIDEAVGSSLLAESMLKRLRHERDCLLATIPARSDDPSRYRDVIYDAAVQIVRDEGNGEASDADSNEAFRAAYPEYFAQSGVAANLLHQRFSRARADVRALLQTVIHRDELT